MLQLVVIQHKRLLTHSRVPLNIVTTRQTHIEHFTVMQIRTNFKPGDLGYVIYLHGVLYKEEYGLDRTFEGDVAARMGEFARSFDSGKDYFAVAENEGQIVGSVAINDFVGRLPTDICQMTNGK